VLVVTYGGGHANMAIPTILRMRERGLDVTALGATTAGPQLRAAGIAATGYRDLLRDDDGSALAVGRELLGDSHDPSTGISVEESTAYLGLSYQDLVDRLGPDEAKRRYDRYGRHAFLQLGPMRRAIERYRPSVVLTTNSPKSERAALVVAGELGIPTIAIEDCLGIRQKIFPEHVPTFTASSVCVLSQIATPYLVAQGTAASSVRLTGNPAFDALAAIEPDARTRTRDALGIAVSAPLVLFTGQAYTRLERLAPLIAAIRSAVPQSRVAVRRHPSRRTPESARLLGALPNVIVTETQPISDLLVASDVLLTISSTTAIESILLGRPVVQLGPELGLTDERNEHADDLPLYRHGAAELARSIDEVTQAVARALDPAARDALLRRAQPLFVAPGTAALAIADLAASLSG